MESLRPYLFIHTGLIIRLLRQSQGFQIETIISESKKLDENLTEAGFLVSSQGLSDLGEFVEKLEKETDKTREITPSEVKKLGGIMGVVEKMVYAEAHTKLIYVMSEQRYSLDCLLYHHEKMFKDGVFKKLPLIARLDLTEGFLCLVFSRATASAFHILRATEAILREYYFTKIKRGREKHPMWGNMVIGLNKRRDRKVSLLKRLEYIKDSFRNPTSHPEVTYNIEGARIY